jgi:NAD(P)H-flavin reductase
MMSPKKEDMTPTPYMIDRVIKETHDTFTLELQPLGENGTINFQPGQFNMLYMFGIGEVPISISGDPADPGRILHTIRAYGAVTTRMMILKSEDAIGVRGPFGNHWPIAEMTGRDLLLVAGGIGIAPLRPVLYHILANRGLYGRVMLFYGERTPADLIYRDLLERWRGRFDMDIDVTVDSAREGWRGNVGVVTTLLQRIKVDAHNCIAMLCGPEIMMHYALEELEHLGLNEDQIYVSMERNMKCGTGFCGHCQAGPIFICRDGPVFRFDEIKHIMGRREI